MIDHDDTTTTPPPGEAPRLPPPAKPRAVSRTVAEQLVEQARADGVELVGPGGLLSDLTKQVLETSLEVELEEHLGYAKHAVEGRNWENCRNGNRSKTVIAEVGPVQMEAHRDHQGTFEPKMVKKRQRRLDGVSRTRSRPSSSWRSTSPIPRGRGARPGRTGAAWHIAGGASENPDAW